MKREKMKLVKSWAELLSHQMTKEQLLLLWHFRNDYSPEMAAVTKDALMQHYGVSEEELSKNRPDHFINEPCGTKELFVETLKTIGAKSHFLYNDFEEDEDGFIGISYQDKSFEAKVFEEDASVTLWVNNNYFFKPINEEEVVRMLQVVNELNDRTPATLIFEKARLWGYTIHTRMSFTFLPVIPNLNTYLDLHFRTLFRISRLIDKEIEQLKLGKQERDNTDEWKRLKTKKIKTKPLNITTRMTAHEPQPIVGNRDLLLKTLKKMGCIHTIDDDNDICFYYQGEQFIAFADNAHKFIGFYDYGWDSVNLDDIDEVSRLRRAINEANWESSVNIVFTINDDKRKMVLSSRADFLFVKSITYLDDYLKTILNEFFRAKRLVTMELDRLKEAERPLNQ